MTGKKKKTSGAGENPPVAAIGDSVADPTDTRRVLLAAVLVIVFGVIAFWNSFDGVFVFDDIREIQNGAWLTEGFWGGLKSQFRPMVGMTYSLNHYLSDGPAVPWDYHLFNLLIHLGAGLALLGVVRRTLVLPVISPALRGASLPLATICAAIWTVHPLQTESVTYIAQRAEAMMGLFLLLTLYCFIRSATTSRPAVWLVASVLFCTMGMATKQAMITAPLLVLAYDWFFVGDGVGRILRRRWWYYLCLFVSIVLLYGSIAYVFTMTGLVSTSQEGVGATVNAVSNVERTGAPITRWSYLISQAAVLVHYFALTYWPGTLNIDYAWPASKSLGEVWWQMWIVLAILAGTIVLVIKCSPWGFLGVWFFINLAPRSSIIPRPDIAVEHRMYLPLAAIVVATVAAVYLAVRAICRRLSADEKVSGRMVWLIGGGVFVIVIASLAMRTAERNADYYSEVDLWQQTVAANPDNYRAHNNLGRAMGHLGDHQAAADEFAIAAKLCPSAETLGNLSRSQMFCGRIDQAGRTVITAIRYFPTAPSLYDNLNMILERGFSMSAAKECLVNVLAVHPDFAPAYFSLAIVDELGENWIQAIEMHRKAIELSPQNNNYRNRLAWLMATCPDSKYRNGNEALVIAREISYASSSNFAPFLDTLAAAYAECGQFDMAVNVIGRAIELTQKLPALQKQYIYRRDLYRSGKAFRQTRKSPAAASNPTM